MPPSQRRYGRREAGVGPFLHSRQARGLTGRYCCRQQSLTMVDSSTDSFSRKFAEYVANCSSQVLSPLMPSSLMQTSLAQSSMMHSLRMPSPLMLSPLMRKSPTESSLIQSPLHREKTHVLSPHAPHAARHRAAYPAACFE